MPRMIDCMIEYQNNLQTLRLKELLYSAKNVVFCSHSSPDGDAVGCLLAFANFFDGIKNYSFVLPDPCPEFLRWMPLCDRILDSHNNPAELNKAFETADLLVALDFNDPGRLKSLSEIFLSSNALKVCIDHHPLVYDKYDALICTVNTSSASELVYQFLMDCSSDHPIDKNTATAIYTGIITDTGSLSFSCNHPSTYSALVNLVNAGVDGAYVHTMVFDNYPCERTKLLGYVLNDKLIVNPQRHFAYYAISLEELDRFAYRDGYMEGFINYALNNRNVKLAASFVEQNDRVRISLRSKGRTDVNKLAMEHFNGGGHVNASGGSWYVDTGSAIELFLEVVDNYICD
ncbi:MAG: DHH family phosphoesterase [Bacteroidales bacterium]|nr:DHH family phosphoesterase [Bacteroidales bacterium]